MADLNGVGIRKEIGEDKGAGGISLEGKGGREMGGGEGDVDVLDAVDVFDVEDLAVNGETTDDEGDNRGAALDGSFGGQRDLGDRQEAEEKIYRNGLGVDGPAIDIGELECVFSLESDRGRFTRRYNVVEGDDEEALGGAGELINNVVFRVNQLNSDFGEINGLGIVPSCIKGG